ncbi:DUF4263 domain-containing protein [bacterium]|nr:DUF4263 domain-containing protein [bacterium]
MELKKYLKESSPAEIANRIAVLAADRSAKHLEELIEFLTSPSEFPIDKHWIPYLVCRAVVQYGREGLDLMYGSLLRTPSWIYAQVILRSLWYTAEGSIPKSIMVPENLMLLIEGKIEGVPDADAQQAANQNLRKLISEAAVDSEYFYHLASFLYNESVHHGLTGDQATGQWQEKLFSLMTESMIKVSPILLDRFVALIDRETSEEEYHVFLNEHPSLLDPLATDVKTKKALGVDYVTDFAIKLLNNRYVLVEIEKPQDRIFTRKNDFSADLSHALGQVVDFLEWVTTNNEYAKKLLPGIQNPRGLLVMGRRTNLSAEQQAKLAQFNLSLSNIDIITYDDIVDNARNLLENLLRR